MTATYGNRGRRYLGRGELYLPAFGLGRCDVCGLEAEEASLGRVTIEPATTITVLGRKVLRVARVAYICRHHPGELAQGVPIGTPNQTMARGTSRLRPQPLALFDDLSLKKGGGLR